MRIKKYLIIFVVFSLGLGLSFVIFAYGPMAIFTVSVYYHALTHPIEEFNPKIVETVKEKDADGCKKFYSTSRRVCYGLIAEMNNDISVCERIKEKEYKDRCKLNVKHPKPVCQNLNNKKINLSIGGEILNDFDYNSALCKKFSSQDSRDSCYGLVALETCNLEVCEKTSSNTRKEECYIKSAYRYGLAGCNKLTNEKLMGRCYERYARSNYLYRGTTY